MSRLRVFILVVGAAIIIGAGAVWYFRPMAVPPVQTFALLTDSEMSDLQGSDSEPLVRSLDVTNTSGPLIRVSSPSGASLISPVNFDIQVEPNGGVPVNMSSIRIEYKIGPAWINMTGRIMKYAKITGNRLYASGAELPAGKHALRVSIDDEQKRRTQATVTFKVK